LYTVNIRKYLIFLDDYFLKICKFRAPFKNSMKMKKIYLVLFSLILMSSAAYSQSATCATAAPFCAGGATFTFPNTTGVPSLGSPGCLGSAPNPAWFYMQISISGNISFFMSQGNNPPAYDNLDVDFICWGPFPTPTCNGLYDFPDGNTSIPNNVVGCSYSGNATESFTIPGAIAGQIYMVLITNFSNGAGQITLTQTNSGQPGAGATDCNILCPLTLADEVICPGNQAILTATIAGATSYQWSSSVTGPIAGNTQSIVVTQAATYTVVVNKPGCVANSTASADVTLAIPPAIQNPSNLTQCSNIPNFDLTPNLTSIFNGTGLTPGNYDVSFHHSATDAQNIANPIVPATAYPTTATIGNPETIYLSISDNTSGGCVFAFPFTLDVTLCQATPLFPGDLHECDITPASPTDDAIFDFTPQTALALGINPASDYTITYHLSQADADNDANAISPITSFANTSNPQTIYIRMEENANPATFGTIPFQLIVDPLPTATISGTTSICSGNTAVITFTGTPPNAVIDYTAGGVPAQTTLVGGTSTVTTPALTNTTVYALVGVTNPTTTCTQTQAGSATVTVVQLPTATISGGTTVCKDAASPSITFTGANGVAPYTFTYNINGGTNQTATTLIGNNTTTVAAPTTATGTFTYNLVSVSSATTPACSQNQPASTVVIVDPLPTATISGTTSVCPNGTAVITFSGTPGATVTYTVNGGANQTIPLNAGTNTITTPALTVQTTYALVSVASAGPTVCSQAQIGSAIISISPLPTATISGSTSICSGNTAVITFTGTPPDAVIDYTVGGTPAQTTLVGGTSTVTTPALTNTTVYALVGVTNPTTTCTQTQVGSATVTVVQLPTATISGTTAVCKNAASPLLTFTGANGVAPYTFTYNINGGTNITVPTTVGNSVTVAAPTTATGTFTYNLVSVSSATTPACSQNQPASAVITVNPLPTATISGATSVCLNDPSPLITFTGANGTPPYTFTYNVNGGGNQTAISSGNTATVAVVTTSATTYTYNLISVVDASSTTCSQLQAGSQAVTINDAPIINNPTPYQVCDDNNDGLSCLFILTTKDFQITGGNPNVVVTYHETMADAQLGSNPQASPYCSLDNTGLQTLYIRAHYLGSPACYSTTTLQLVVNGRPLPNPVITDYELCDQNLVPGVGQEVFNLPTKTAEIANGLLGVTVNYYSNQPDAIAQTNPLPNLYTNTTSPQQIWINISNNATGCNSVSSFNLVVHPLPSAVAPPPMFECSNGVSNQALFNLSLNDPTASNGVPGVTVTYYNSLSDAQNETGAISSTSYLGTDNEIVYIRVENDATGCYATETILLRVTQGPLAVAPQPQQRCDPNNDGFEVFNLEDSTNEIAGGVLPAGVTVTYHETQTDAELGANPLVSPYTNIEPWSQIIYVRVFYTLTGCSNYVQLKLNVNPTPEATTPADYHTCDDNYDGIANFDLTTRINEVLGAINPATHTVTFYTSLANAQTPINPIINTISYPNATPNTQTIWIRVETIATGCFDIVTLQLIVDPLPNATQPNYPQYSLCDTTAPIGYEVFDLGSQINAISLGQTGMNVTFHFSQADADADANALPLLYQNVPIYVQTIWIRIENASTGCYVVSTMDIRVEPLPTPIPPTQPYTVCDDNQDGFTDFDLETLTAGILQGPPIPIYTITYHETLTDAQLGDNDLVSPYTNTTPYIQFIYVRAEDVLTGCVSVIIIELNADPSPVMPTTLPNLTNCDQDSNTQNSNTLFDLTQQTGIILAAQSGPASDYTVTYFETLADAQAGAPMIISPSTYQGNNGQTIWARIENNTTRCFSIGTFQLFVNAPLLLITPAPLSICDNDTNPNNLFTEFDLTVKDAIITQNLAGYTVTYYPSYPVTAASVAIANPTTYTNAIPAVQTLGVMVTSPQGCKSYTTLDIRVLPVPVPRTDPPALAPLCDDNSPGDMMEVFDLTTNAAYIINNDPNVTLHYFASQADAEANPPVNELIPANAALVGQNVWIRVENTRVDYQGNHCYVLVEQALTVNPLPTVVQAPTLLPFYSCDNDADGISTFDLQDQIVNLLGLTQDPADYTVSFYATAAGANPITNTGELPLAPSGYQNVTPFTEDVYVRIVNNATGCVNPAGILTLIVEEAAVANPVTTPPTCDNYNDPHDGVIQVDLTSFDATVLAAQDPTIFLITYYHTQAEAEAGVAGTEIASPTTYETAPDDDTVWIRVTNSATTSPCHDVTPLVIHIERYPDPTVITQNDVHTICVDYNTQGVIRDLLLEASNPIAGSYTYQWFENNVAITGETNPTYLVNMASTGGATRNYTVEMTSVALGCATMSPVFDVIQSGPAVIANGIGYTVTNAFEQNQIITVDVVGFGTYQYSLDDGPRQDSNIFENVNLGEHWITVWDTEGGLIYSCDSLIIQDVSIIDYPHYFTPNGDGIHDTWNIVGLDGQPTAKIYIFDRYGKLLKQISSTGAGWDGTFNGKLLPSTDYWFTVDFAEGLSYRQFKAHFSLKR